MSIRTTLCFFKFLFENTKKTVEEFLRYLFNSINLEETNLPKDGLINQEINEFNQKIMFACLKVSR